MDRVWHRYYEAGVPRKPVYPDKPLPALIAETAFLHGGSIALEFLGTQMTFAALWSRVMRFAEALSRLGVKAGTRVAVMLPNSPQAVVSVQAVLWLGAIVVMTNPLYVERELEHQWSDAGVEFLIVLDHLVPRAARVVPLTPVRKTVVTSLAEALPWPSRLLYPLIARLKKLPTAVPYGDDVLNFSRLLKETPPGTPDCRATLDDVALLQYTGGTTGIPKGVMLTHRNLLSNVVQLASWVPGLAGGNERFLSIIPFFHAFGMTVAMQLPLYTGCASIVVPRFKPRELMKIINRKRPTIFPGVPALFLAIVNDPEVRSYDTSSIRFCVTGSAPMPLDALRRFEEMTGGVILEGYGLTEASPVTHVNPVSGPRKSGTIGIPLPDTDHRIVDMEGGDRDVPLGEIGELLIRGPQVMKGYWGLPEETSEVLRDGWLATGDVARVDDEGYVTIVDRKKDLVLTSGYNVYPREIEEVLYEHPKIMDAAAVGVPDARRGEAIRAFVVLRPGERVQEAELIAFCKERLAAYKVPRHVEFRDSLPKTLVGKISKKELRRDIQESGVETAPLRKVSDGPVEP